MDVDSTSNEPQHVEELWFDDGHLVIQAGTSQFRVYRAHTEYYIVIGCLRLSHKSGLDSLRRRALIHIYSGYRTTLSDWDAVDNEMGDRELAYDLPSWDWCTDPASKIHVVHVAREVNALWLLPVAFYRISDSLAGKFWNDIFDGTSYNGIPVSLSEQDQESFLKGHEMQSCSIWGTLRFLTHPPSIAGCTSSSQCLADRLRVLDEFQERIRVNLRNPLEIWSANAWDRFDDDEICRTCLRELQSIHSKARQAFWDMLPEIYDLPTWEELKEMQVAAIGTEWLR
ncbi:hypothetical protein C8R43DRAFT_942685 [Mycena crocata]|nr:hypothetical protein C8R43DRAFT_942685 [Mycena crocata]